jgi:tol-pal system protein YbgF
MARFALLIVSTCAALAAQFVHAAAPVVESQGTNPTTTTRPSSTPSTSSSSSGVRAYGADQAQIVASEPRPSAAVPPSSSVSSGGGSGSGASSMFQQFQQVQDDVAELRGIVEEQSHQIEQLQAQQKEQYLDLDRRMSALQGGGGSAPGPSSTGGGPTAGGGSGPTTGPVSSGPTTASGNAEQDAYTAAYNSAKANRFTEAIAAFNQVLVMYPTGKYAGNSYYWLGELYLKLPEPALEKSRQSFAQVVNQFKDNAHVSEAMFKLGVVYDRMGDKAKALEYLKRVQAEYPGTPGAKLAQTYAAELH